MILKLIKISIFLTLASAASNDNKLKIVNEWNELEFKFPNEKLRTNAINDRSYIRGNSIPMDVDVFYGKDGKRKTFVTIPRFDIGRPYTLTRVRDDKYLEPYPDFKYQNIKGNNCDGITSVFKTAIDECSRLWVLDTGKIGPNIICPAKLLVIDLNTDTVIHKYVFPETSQLPRSIFVTPVIDVRDPNEGCHNTFVYISDITGFRIVVYDYANNNSWWIQNKLCYPHPPQGTFTITGQSFDLMDGILGLALSPFIDEYDDRTLYFHALASVTENYVKTSVIRNGTMWQGQGTMGLSPNPREFKVFENVRVSQSAAEGMDKTGVMYFGLMSTTAIGCWNSNGDYAPKNMDIVSYNKETLQFPSGIKIINNPKGGQELWVLSCRFQRFMTGTMTSDTVNFRIQTAKVKDLVAKTKCDPNYRTTH